MKIYSYKINIDQKYQELVQSRPFLNCSNQSINQEIINYLKSKDLEINEIETQNRNKIINWENIDEKLSYKKFKDKIKLFDLNNDLDEVSIKRVAEEIAHAMDYVGHIQFDTSFANGQYKKTANNSKLLKALRLSLELPTVSAVMTCFVPFVIASETAPKIREAEFLSCFRRIS